MAVAAHQGSFCLYALKSMDEIRGAVQGDGLMDGSRFQPVKEVSIPDFRETGQPSTGPNLFIH